MKKFLVIFLILASVTAVYAAASDGIIYSMGEIFNYCYNPTSQTLKVSGTVATTAGALTTTEFKRATLSPNTDSGTNLGFAAEASHWSIVNLSTTVPVYIKFGSAATTADFKLPANSSISGESKVTTIHVIAADTAEVQTVGLY